MPRPSSTWLLELLGLGALWGGSYVLIRVAVPEVGPVPLVWLRVAIAVLALSPVVIIAARSGFRPDRRLAGRLLLLGTVNAALPFTLIAAAQVHLTASMSAILNATTALFTAAIAAAVFGERLGVARAAALVVGLTGVGLVVGLSDLPGDRASLLAVGACLLAALSYAVGTTWAGRGFRGVPPPVMAFGQQAATATVLLIPATATATWELPSAKAALCVAGLGLLCTAGAYLLYFHLVTTVGPTRTSLVTFLVPCFGVLFGVTLLGEHAGPSTLLGGLLVLASVLLVGRRPKPAPAPAPLPRPGVARPGD
jgi:drug/metabolite transporter (DMT)-like permease